MRITAIEEYGIRCLLHVARDGQTGKSVNVREIAEREGISQEYASKILTQLRQGGLVQSVRGMLGGYVLARPAEQISMTEILRTLDDALVEDGKLTEGKLCERFPGQTDGCVHKEGCSVRPLWLILSNTLYGSLTRITLKDMLERSEEETAKHIRAAFKEYAGTL